MEKDADNIVSWLPFIIQFGQTIYIEKFLRKCSYEFWENVCDLTAQLCKGQCCICLHQFSNYVEVDWNQLSFMILKSLGPTNALKLLLKYASNMPKGDINIR